MNLGLIPQYAAHLAQSEGVRGVFICGTTGESLVRDTGPWCLLLTVSLSVQSLTLDERKQLCEAWVKAAAPHKLAVVAHIGCDSVEEAKQLAAHGGWVRSCVLCAICCVLLLYCVGSTLLC